MTHSLFLDQLLDSASNRYVVHAVDTLVEQGELIAAPCHVAQVGARATVGALVGVPSPSATSQVHRVASAVHGDVRKTGRVMLVVDVAGASKV